MSEHHRIDGALECRDATGSPGRLVGVILPVGRVAGDRPELFVGSGVQTPSEGIALLPEHRSTTVVMRFDPVRDADGSLRVDHLLPDTPEGLAIAASVRSGKTPGLSVEFHSLDEARVVRCPGGSSLAHNGGRHGAEPELRPGARRSPIQAAAGVAVKWPWRRPEVREANYTEQVVSRLLAAASAKGDGGALGAIETAARWYGGRAQLCPCHTI